MKVKRHDGGDLKLVLAGMATDPVVCARIASQWDGELFDDEDANLVAGWIVRHMKSYGQPPNGRLRGIFDEWASGPGVDEDRARAIESKLEAISREHERTSGPVDPRYVLDRAGAYFSKVRLKRRWEEVEAELDRGDVGAAYSKMTGTSRVELGAGSVVKLSEDYEAWREALDEERERPLLAYSGDLDWFLGPATTRESLLAFMGPDKSFKSFWIMDAGFRALRAGCRVAMFECGDLPRAEIMGRMAARFAKRPIKAMKYRVPASVDEEGKIEWKLKETTDRLSPGAVFKLVRKACRGRDVFRLSCHPTETLDVHGLESVLRDWARDGWVADVVLIDYADIMAAPKGVKETLDQIDKTWKGLSRIRQEFHCLVVTGTQSSALAYSNKSRVLGRQHFSGRKTKLAEVTGMIGLSVTDEGRKNCVTGLNWIVRRSGRVSEKRQVMVAGCLDIGNPAMKTFSWKPEKSREDQGGSV